MYVTLGCVVSRCSVEGMIRVGLGSALGSVRALTSSSMYDMIGWLGSLGIISVVSIDKRCSLGLSVACYIYGIGSVMCLISWLGLVGMQVLISNSTRLG